MQPTIHMIHEVTKEHTNALAALVARACEHIKHVCSTHCFDITGIHANAKNAHTRHSLHAIVPRLPPAVIYNHTMKSQQPRQRIQLNHKEYACCRNSEITKKSQRKEYCFCTNNLVSLRKATKDAQCQHTVCVMKKSSATVVQISICDGKRWSEDPLELYSVATIDSFDVLVLSAGHFHIGEVQPTSVSCHVNASYYYEPEVVFPKDQPRGDRPKGVALLYPSSVGRPPLVRRLHPARGPL